MYTDRANGFNDPVTFAPQMGLIGAVTAAGSSISDAAALPNAVNKVTGADGAKGVILPSVTLTNGRLGTVVFVQNITAAALLVYPQSGGTVSGGSTSASCSVASGSNALFIAIGADTWIGLEAPKP